MNLIDILAKYGLTEDDFMAAIGRAHADKYFRGIEHISRLAPVSEAQAQRLAVDPEKSWTFYWTRTALTVRVMEIFTMNSHRNGQKNVIRISSSHAREGQHLNDGVTRFRGSPAENRSHRPSTHSTERPNRTYLTTAFPHQPLIEVKRTPRRQHTE